jgi:hypothetical protein
MNSPPSGRRWPPNTPRGPIEQFLREIETYNLPKNLPTDAQGTDRKA